MLSFLYKKFLARDKMLRHTFQHFEIALFGLFLYSLITQQVPTISILPLFFFFTYLPDFDGLSSIFIWYGRNPVATEVVNRIGTNGIKSAFSYATIHHKKLNRLLFHNFVAYPFFVGFLVWAIITRQYYLGLSLTALVTHFTFDISDDIFQMGNVKNWLWPLHMLFPKIHWFDPNRVSYPIPQMHKYITTEPTDYIFKKK